MDEVAKSRIQSQFFRDGPPAPPRAQGRHPHNCAFQRPHLHASFTYGESQLHKRLRRLSWMIVIQAGAIAGGNAVVLKPSEQAPATAQLLAELVPQYLDRDLFHVINGGIPETTKVCWSKFEYIKMMMMMITKGYITILMRNNMLLFRNIDSTSHISLLLFSCER